MLIAPKKLSEHLTLAGGSAAFSPASISSLTEYWTADTGYNSGTGVWTGQKNGNVATFVTSKPTATTNGGKNVLAFASASSQSLSVPHAATLNLGDVWSIFIVVQQTSAFVDGCILSKGNNNYAAKFAGSGKIQAVKDTANGSGALVLLPSSTNIDTALNKFTIVKNAETSVTIRQNGADISGTPNNTFTVDNTSALVIGYDGTNYLNGQIRAICLFTAAITSTDATNLEAYF